MISEGSIASFFSAFLLALAASFASFALSFSKVSINSLTSIRANRISGFASTVCPHSKLPNSSRLSAERSDVLNSSRIFSAVSGIKLLSKTAAIRMLSNRLYNTVAKRSFLLSSLPNTQGVVSSIYLLQRFNKVKISSMASPTCNVSIFLATRFGVSNAKSISSLSISSRSNGLEITPLKYLFCIEIVRFTRFPKTFAKSEFIRSTIKSQVIVPSCANGISCNTK